MSEASSGMPAARDEIAPAAAVAFALLGVLPTYLLNAADGRSTTGG
ncbi:MAG TPA: hypothetical protein VKV16_06350 [Solirubrobacteraceae bacterium]|nr:hypothetical protein [Solirubrobacteraceae bacterium]